MGNTLDRRAQAEAALQADALQAATNTLAQRAAQHLAQEQRVQAELDRYLDRSMLWQTSPAPEPQYFPVPHHRADLPMPYAEAEYWPVPEWAARPEPSRVNWPAVVAVGGTLAVLPYLVPVVVAAAAPAVAAVVSVLAYAAGGAAVLLAVRAALSSGRSPEVPTERLSRKIVVTVEVED